MKLMMRTGGALLAMLALVACGKSEPKAGTPEPAPKTAGATDPAATAAPAEPATAATPAPPSTGREMPAAPVAAPPQLDPQKAAQIVVAAVEEGKKLEPDCELVVQSLFAAIPVAAPRLNKETLPAYDTFAACLSKTSRWQMLLDVGYLMLDAVPDQARPWFVPRALVGLGRYDAAAVEIQRLAQKYPDDVELAATAGLLYCSLEKWPLCLEIGDKLVAALAGGDASAFQRNTERAHMLRAESLLHLGKLDEAEQALAAAEKVRAGAPYLTPYRQRIAMARKMGLLVDDLYQLQLPLGAYHLYGSDASAVGGPVVKLTIKNIAAADRQLRVDVEIPGVTEKTTRTVMLLKGHTEVVALAPPLKMDFDLKSVRSQRQAQLSIKLTAVEAAGERVLIDTSAPITLLPRDALLLIRRVGNDSVTNTFEFIAAWITPNARPVDEFLAIAKKRVPDGRFVGEQGATGPQVKALWEELQSRGVSYVMDPSVVSDLGLVQRTRLPSEVLASTNAQCLEGTILFATLMEAIGLRPIIVMVPGHAFVGWHATAADGLPAGTPVFLETTMVHDATFDAAVKLAVGRVTEEEKAGNFKRGVSHLIELTVLRQRGVTPQPID